jgi:hypothetical protein
MNAPDPIKSLASPVDMVDICLLHGGIYKVSVNDDLQGVCVCVCGKATKFSVGAGPPVSLQDLSV